ncbi:MAG: Shedu immune nuclease family protein [Chloroflexota bacterium]
MIKETKGKDGNVVWRVDKSKNFYEYVFIKDSAQGKLIKRLIFKDATKKPIGFSQAGYGFRGALRPIYFLLRDSFSEIDEIIIASQKSSITRRKIHFNKKEYDSMVASLGTVYKENSNRLTNETLIELEKIFPQKFKSKTKSLAYTSGTLARILSKKGVVDQMNSDDIGKVVELLPLLMDKSEKAKVGFLSKIQFADLRNKSTKIELKKIVDEFDRLLKKRNQKESEWQEFFKKNMLFINSAYIKLIDKKNINITVSIPDFLLIDQFQFMDVFEIKKPDFDCLKFDKSHNNYYWSTEASMAIAQVEKYLFELEQNSHLVVADLRKQKIDVNIIRPRGYVLIGKRTDYDENAQNSFKILNDSLKNVQVIFFDDLLNTLKSKYIIIKKK